MKLEYPTARLHEEACAVVVSQNGVILRLYRGAEFPFIELSRKNFVPPKSLTARSRLPEGVVSDLEEVDSALWMPSSRGSRLPTLYEQTLAQRDGFRLSLLAIEAAEEDEVQEGEDLERSWTPHFRR